MNYSMKHSIISLIIIKWGFEYRNCIRWTFVWTFARTLIETKRAKELIFCMEVPTVMSFPKIYRYCALSAKFLMILAFLVQNFVKSC